MALHIYRVGRSVPIRSRNPNKSRVKIQLLTRIGCFGPVWPPLDRSDRADLGTGLPGGITSSSGLQIERSIYAFRSSRWDLRNGVVQLTIWQTFPDRSDRFVQDVWPVCPDHPENLNRANFGCQHMPPCFLVTLAYRETFLQAKAILKQWEALVHQYCLAFKGDIVYWSCHLILLNILTSIIDLMMTRLLLNPSCLHSPDLSMYLGLCKYPTISSLTTTIAEVAVPPVRLVSMMARPVCPGCAPQCCKTSVFEKNISCTWWPDAHYCRVSIQHLHV